MTSKDFFSLIHDPARKSSLRANDLDLREVELERVDLRGARLEGCDFTRARLAGADLSQAVLRACRFDHAALAGAQLVEARLEDASAEGADFSGANLTRAHLTETVFTRAVLRDAALESAEGGGVVFRGSDLRHSSLRGANLLAADFRGADLTGADLTGARLKGADFRGAILDNVNWSEAGTAGARFDTGVTPQTPAQTAEPLFDAVQDLIRQAIADPRIAAIGAKLESAGGTGADADPAKLLEALRAEMTSRGADISGVLEPFEQALAALQSAPDDEPPEEWKAWLENIMRDPPPALAAVLTKLQKPPGNQAES